MSKTYYKESCMCRHPMPSRIIPERCAWCGGIIPPSVRALLAVERDLERSPSGGAILAIVLLAVGLLAMVAFGRITLIASRHDPVAPSLSAHYEPDAGEVQR
jgi:hypothetical protein